MEELPTDPPSIGIMATYPDGGVAWGFEIEEHDDGGRQSLRLCMFEDSWPALIAIPTFFAVLARGAMANLQGVPLVLDRLGAVDETRRQSPYEPTTTSRLDVI